MTKKSQKIIKILKQIADDLDNVGLNDSAAWQKLSTELEGVLKSVPKKKSELKDILDLVLQGLNIMGNRKANDALSLVDAIWQGLNSAEQSLSDQPDSDIPAGDILQNLAGLVQSAEKSDDDAPAAESAESGSPPIDSLDDAAAFLIQIESDNHSELQNLRDSLLGLTIEGQNLKEYHDFISQAVEKINEMMDGKVEDPDQSLTEVGSLLESAMHSRDGLYLPMESANAQQTDAQLNTVSSEDDPDFNHMPQDADTELIGEFIAEGSDLISNAEEALLSLETDPTDMESVSRDKSASSALEIKSLPSAINSPISSVSASWGM